MPDPSQPHTPTPPPPLPPSLRNTPGDVSTSSTSPRRASPPAALHSPKTPTTTVPPLRQHYAAAASPAGSPGAGRTRPLMGSCGAPLPPPGVPLSSPPAAPGGAASPRLGLPATTSSSPRGDVPHSLSRGGARRPVGVRRGSLPAEASPQASPRLHQGGASFASRMERNMSGAANRGFHPHHSLRHIPSRMSSRALLSAPFAPSGAPSAAASHAPGDDSQYHKDELLAKTVVSYLVKSVKSSRQRGELIIHVVMVAVLCLMLSLTKIEGNSSRPFFVYSAVKEMALGTPPPEGMVQGFPGDFEDITNSEQFWSWADGFFDRVWPDPGAAAAAPGGGADDFFRQLNDPLAYVILYQQRVGVQPCGLGSISAILSPSVQQRGWSACDSSGMSDVPFGPRESEGGAGFKYHANSVLHRFGAPTFALNTAAIKAETRIYHGLGEDGQIFMEVMHLNESVSAVKQRLKDLRDDNWFDWQTRIIGLDFFMFNRVEGFFVRCQVFTEVTAGGQLRPQFYFSPFSLQASGLSGGRDYFVLFLDGLILVLVLVEAVGLITSVKSNLELEGDWRRAFGVWELMNVINVGLFAANYYFRFELLKISQSGGDNIISRVGGRADEFDAEMYKVLAIVASHFQNNAMYQGMNVALSWLRLFQYLQFSERLNVVSETVKQAAGELIAMAVIAMIILMAYAFSGHLLFGTSCSTFRDFSRSFGTLLRFVYGDGAYSEQFPEMVHAYPVASSIYIVSYLIIIWLILLNLVLAIITGSFAVVQESMAQSDWSIVHLYQDAVHALHRLRIILRFKPLRRSIRRFFRHRRRRSAYALKAEQPDDGVSGVPDNPQGRPSPARHSTLAGALKGIQAVRRMEGRAAVKRPSVAFTDDDVFSGQAKGGMTEPAREGGAVGSPAEISVSMASDGVSDPGGGEGCQRSCASDSQMGTTLFWEDGNGLNNASDDEGASDDDNDDDDDDDDDDEEEDPIRQRAKVTTRQKIRLIKLLRGGSDEGVADGLSTQYVTHEELMRIASFLTEEQIREILAQSRKVFTGKQQMLKMGERLAQHMNSRLFDIEMIVERLSSVEPVIHAGFPQLQTSVTNRFDQLSAALNPQLAAINKQVEHLQGVPSTLSSIRTGLHSLSSGNQEVSHAIQKVRSELVASLAEQAGVVQDIVAQVDALQTVPSTQQELLLHLNQASDTHKRTTESMLKPLKGNLAELVKLVRYSNLGEGQGGETAQQTYDGMVQELFSGPMPSPDPTAPVVPASRLTMEAEAVHNALADLRTEDLQRGAAQSSQD